MQFRCPWCGVDPLYMQYHDTIWGVPEYNDKALFAKLILDGAQAGLSWITILRKEAGYREVFDDLDPEKMALYDSKRIEKILTDPRIVRNRLKVESAVSNAQIWVNMRDEGISFGKYLWNFTDGRPTQNAYKSLKEVPASTPLSDIISKDLKKRGFRFVGTTIVYAFMQAVGMVNDHLVDCFRHAEVQTWV
ncbi:MAG TPA: DNA-3-methyladenine glycosylase I [Saprospiraceae bacterium]|nr:DNA-3-methyladenine glycosylase I [Saprospiraceae bacterium]